jgi:hypothetical protein
MSELDPVPGRVLIPGDGGELRPAGERAAGERAAGDPDASADFTQLARWLNRNWIWLTGVLLVGAQTWWMSSLLAHSYFKLDDFVYIERASKGGLTWSYLMWVNAGKLTPLGNLITWIVTRISPYDWSLISAVTLVLLAAAGLAVLRLLHSVFGDRPGILLLLVVYLLSPLFFPGLSWWSVVMELLPFEIGMLGALTAHMHYLRTGRFRHAVAATGWLLVCMASSIKGAAVPVLLFAITSAFMTSGTWRRATLVALRLCWRAWLLYGTVMLGYFAVYAYQLKTSSQAPGAPGTVADVIGFAWTLIHDTLIPGLLGGPWHWFAVGDYGTTSTPAGFAWVATVVAVAIIGMSIWYRLRAWRGWAILAAWVICVDVLPVLAGRGEILTGVFLGTETRYVLEVPALTALILGLAFLPVAPSVRQRLGERQDVAVVTIEMSRPVTGAVVALFTVIVIGSLWSFHQYIATTTSAPGRSYLATARLALAEAPPGTVIVSAPTPSWVMGGQYVSPADALTSNMLAPISKHEPRFVSTRPDGTFDHLMEFDGWGRLATAVVVGSSSRPLTIAQACWPQTGNSVVVQLQGAPSQATELRIGYVGWSSGQVTVSYAGQAQTYQVRQGLHNAFLPVSGSADTVTITGMGPRQLCVGDVQVGSLLPDTSGQTLPALAVAG